MKRTKSYKPGTIVTLKDGNVYRTTHAKTTLACTECVAFYGCSSNCPCYKQALIKFAFPPIAANMTICCELYGESMYPKMITK